MKDAARFFKVLADEARLQMLWLLSNQRELCVCDVMAVLDITQSKASRHLLTLKHAGLVRDRKDGLWSHYSLRTDGDALARAYLEMLARNLGRRADAQSLLASLQRRLAGKPRTSLGDGQGTRSAVRPHKAAGGRRPSAAGAMR